ncbi:MAG: ABC transporter permease [Treponema sp.]|jgi:simple sugar transport system permease protein|nr:ABC transporter permease [Treponema sp.]
MRKRPPVYRETLLGALIPLGAALIVPALIIGLTAEDPSRTLRAFFAGPWANRWFLGNTLDKTALFLCASLGAAIAFRGGCFNLGGEGQIYLGGCAAAAILLQKALPDAAALVLAALAAAAAGGVMGALPGLLRKRTGASELITSFLLAAALLPLGDHVISSVLRGSGGNLLATEQFSPRRVLPRLLPPSALSVSIIFALVLVLLFHFFIRHCALGYRFRVSGAAPELARLGGIDAEKRFIPAMTVSGAAAGLTGFFAVAGTYGMCYQGFSGGLGWNAIAVALIAGGEPPLLLPAAFVFSALEAGSSAAALQAGFSFETAAFIEAAALLLAALPLGRRYLSGRLA